MTPCRQIQSWQSVLNRTGETVRRFKHSPLVRQGQFACSPSLIAYAPLHFFADREHAIMPCSCAGRLYNRLLAVLPVTGNERKRFSFQHSRLETFKNHGAAVGAGEAGEAGKQVSLSAVEVKVKVSKATDPGKVLSTLEEIAVNTTACWQHKLHLINRQACAGSKLFSLLVL